jgi:hypothetical protein
LFRRFVPSFAEIVRPLQNMIKKDVVFKWNKDERESFKAIKEAIVQSPALSSPNFNKDFILYTFASDLSCVVVLTQKNDQDIEIPIYFMSTGFQGA